MPPKYDYQCRTCLYQTESHVRESLIWACPVCEETRPLYRVYHAPSIFTVVHEHYNMTTGQVVSDRKQFLEQMHVASEEVSERTNIPHNFVPISMKQDLPTTDEGMDSTHNRAVAEGRKDSRGKFVW